MMVHLTTVFTFVALIPVRLFTEMAKVPDLRAVIALNVRLATLLRGLLLIQP